MSKVIDYLIVGQGLAGSLLADLLLKGGKQIMVYDEGHLGSSTANAAGIINPVTGRRFVKSWMFDQLIEVALAQYQSLQLSLGVHLIRERNIVRSLPDRKAMNDWLMKSQWPDYAPYVVEEPGLEELQEFLDVQGLWSEVTGGYQIDLPVLIMAMRKRLLEMKVLREEHFETELMRHRGGSVYYTDLQAKQVIFCEGFKLASNPLFESSVFLNPSKGENFLLKIPGQSMERMIKRKFFLVPLQDEIYWFGAKDGWYFEDGNPTNEAYDLLKRHAFKLIKVPFEILEHRAAIRPTIKDRRPVIGKHPAFPNVYLFNGLGTKGASLGPYWARTLIQHIEEGSSLGQEVDLCRFANQ